MEAFINELETNSFSSNPFVKSAISGFRIAITNREGVIVWMSEAFCRLTKFSKEELMGKPLWWLSEKSIFNTSNQALKKSILDSLAWEGELCNEAKDGTVFWTKMSIMPVKNASGNEGGFLSISSDITRTKKAEEEKALAVDLALQNEKRYHALIDDQTDLFCVYAGDGTRTYVNDRYCSFFNIIREQILGTNFFSYNPFGIAKEIIHKVKNLTQEEPEVIILYEMKNGNQEWRFIVWRFITFFDKAGNPMEILAIGRDITEVKKAEDQKNNYTEALEKIAFMTSHKVRGPIARSLGLLELIKITGFSTQEGEAVLKHFSTCITELDQYTRELADFIFKNQSLYESFVSSQSEKIEELSDKAENMAHSS